MKELLNRLKDNNILVETIDGELKIFAADSRIDPDLLEEIKEKKELLLQFLLSNDQSTFDELSIPVAAERPYYPLSSSQRRLWMLSQFRDGNIAYNMPGAYVFEGDLHREALEYSFRTLAERHESLRTIFREDENGDVRQFILSPEQPNLRIEYQDLRLIKEQDKEVKRFVEQELIRPFDLSTGPMVRACLLQVADNKWIFIYTLHHIVSDRWSMDILIRELLLLYNAHIRGDKSPLPPLPIQYKDYATWQQDQLSRESLKVHKNYWLRQFEGELPVLELPARGPRPAIRTYKGEVTRRTIGKEPAREIKLISQQEGATLFMGLLAAVNALLYRYTGQQDIIIGSPIAARDHADLQNQIGFYVNTLPIRTRFEGSVSYRKLVAEIKQLTLAAYEHQVYPLDELIDVLNPRSVAGRHPLFDILIELRSHDQRNDDSAASLPGITVSTYEERVHTVSKFDLTFFFTESDKGLEILVEYNSDIYDREAMERLCLHFENLMLTAIRNPDIPIDRLDYIGLDEKKLLLLEFNDTAVHYPAGRTVVDLLEEQAAANPDKVAIIFGETTLTYKELHGKSNLLAHYLKTNFEIRPDDLVGLMLDRSEKTIIAILGILKSGGAYVPIDPEAPARRKSLIIQHTGIKALITQMDYTYDLDYRSDRIFAIDVQLDVIGMTADSPSLTIGPANLAYVIFTSGSTGSPKGCVITHRNLFNYIQWSSKYYFKEGDEPVFGLFTSMAFDLTVTCIFCSLTQGGRLKIYRQEEEIPSILLNNFRSESGINSIKLTPSHINILEHLTIKSSAMQRAIVGGEEVTSRQVNILKSINPSMEIYNEYGPTEATVGCVVARLQPDTRVLIGKPIANTEIYICDQRGLLCPTGIPGEMAIGGEGVANGYLNDPGLTNERFVPNPFKEGGCMYRTGDWGRWLPDGNIEFLGRKDEQVKINGYRIELGEIENALLAQDSIKAAIVLAKKDAAGNNELFAYYVPESPAMGQEDTDALLNSIHKSLKMNLPAYLIPRHLIQLNNIPLTINGKVDRNVLAELEIPGIGKPDTYFAPATQLEERLVEIWQEVLGQERIGIKDNFFELGGNSIKAMRLIAKMNKDMEIEYSFERLFKNPTIGDVAMEIEQAGWINNDIVEIDNTENMEKFSI